MQTHRIGHHLDELLEAELPVPVLVRLHDRLVDDLLQLPVLEVVAHHHLQHEEQLAVRDEPIPVHVVHLECNFGGRASVADRQGNAG